MAIIMQARISSAKENNWKRSFSKGKNLTDVPTSELFSTYLYVIMGSKILSKKPWVMYPLPLPEGGGHKAF